MHQYNHRESLLAISLMNDDDDDEPTIEPTIDLKTDQETTLNNCKLKSTKLSLSGEQQKERRTIRKVPDD